MFSSELINHVVLPTPEGENVLTLQLKLKQNVFYMYHGMAGIYEYVHFQHSCIFLIHLEPCTVQYCSYYNIQL